MYASAPGSGVHPLLVLVNEICEPAEPTSCTAVEVTGRISVKSVIAVAEAPASCQPGPNGAI